METIPPCRVIETGLSLSCSFYAYLKLQMKKHFLLQMTTYFQTGLPLNPLGFFDGRSTYSFTFLHTKP